MIPLMRNTFFNEKEVKQKLSEYILDSNILSMNQKCFEFEKKFADYQNTNFATLFNSGGSANLALLQSLKNLGKLKDGDKIGYKRITYNNNAQIELEKNYQKGKLTGETKYKYYENVKSEMNEVPVYQLSELPSIGTNY